VEIPQDAVGGPEQSQALIQGFQWSTALLILLTWAFLIGIGVWWWRGAQRAAREAQAS